MLRAAAWATATTREFVFPAPEGGHLNYPNWRDRVWTPAVRSSGLDGFTPHCLKHTAAAVMIDQDANPLQLQRRLGHRDVRTTLALYGHLFPEATTN